MEDSLLLQCIIIEEQYNQVNAPLRNRKRAHDSQIARTKENLKFSHDGLSYNQASGTNPPVKASRQSRH